MASAFIHRNSGRTVYGAATRHSHHGQVLWAFNHALVFVHWRFWFMEHYPDPVCTLDGESLLGLSFCGRSALCGFSEIGRASCRDRLSCIVMLVICDKEVDSLVI